MATRGQLKSVEFAQAVLATPPASAIAETLAPAPVGTSNATLKPAVVSRPAAVANGAPVSPRFTAEETILLRGLASGASSKEMAAQMRLPRESLYRLIGDLRRKTGASNDTALAVWVLRNMGSTGGERRSGGR